MRLSVSGIDVEFPYDPYPTQIELIQKLLACINLSHNGLLESPTGTGKTLSLLCGSLAWLHNHQINNTDSEKPTKPTATTKTTTSHSQTNSIGSLPSQLSPEPVENKATQTNTRAEENSDEDFRPPTVRRVEKSTVKTTKRDSVDLSSSQVKRNKRISIDLVDGTSKQKKTTSNTTSTSKYASSSSFISKSTSSPRSFQEQSEHIYIRDVPTTAPDIYPDVKKIYKMPKIYYVTRTHSQIAQIIRELEKTNYRPKISVLASRDHYCIHPIISNSPNKNYECRQLISTEESCSFKKNKSHITHSPAFAPGAPLQIWDIEDLVEMGNKLRACPYFAARSIAQDASLIFCPYNYIIEPTIRDSMKINLKDSIIIFDEAHNIEDTCRSSASVEIKLEDLKIAIIQLRTLRTQSEYLGELSGPFLKIFEKLALWAEEAINSLKPQDFDRQMNVMLQMEKE
eukprot:TRINITY_DN2163_c0_g1_i2.p1 TRINITY_DN2163_c0_g1~~TRINITY_DN2163_c0_g1_i2.p1  ORF type:complete len:455 (+),score=74.05 TRINITY_DN2163_c0_g1_i2:69-1433(+)